MDQPWTERGLVAAAAGGDEAAFRQLVQEHEGAIAATVTAMLGAGDDADDVGQETFVRFLRALPNFRGDAAVRTYLTRIAINLSLDVLARRRRRFGWLRLGVTAERDEPTVAAISPEEIDRDDRRRQIRLAVAALDPIHRAVVVLRILEERSTRETAELLQLPEGTVMSRLKRALARLAIALEPLENDR
ncbi:MAG: RNA polymerase sigma factor [Gemmatimonadota bacterium]